MRPRDSWADEPTVRVPIRSQAEREAELLAQHDARTAPAYPEFAPSGRTYTLAEYQADLETTAHEMPALPDPDREPSWRQVARMGLVDVLAEVIS
jgi:hypothetical protein